MAYELWTSADLYEVLVDTRNNGATDWWRTNYFPNVHLSEKEEILFSELPLAMRRVAPFVLPTEQGKPIYRRQGEALKSFTPAYIKPKDAIRPNEVRRAMPSEVILSGRQMTMEERFDARVADIVQYHDAAIRRQWDLMCARAVQYGRATIRYRRDNEIGEGPPVVTLDFDRDASLTVALAPGADWSDPNHDIIGDISRWRDNMAGLKRGGNANTLLLGTTVVPYFRNNIGLRKLLDTNVRGSETFVMNTGLIAPINDPQNPVVKIAELGEGLTAWSYSDTMENDDGSTIALMDPKSVVMTAPNVGGYQAFGAIYDIEAELQPIDIFMKMFDVHDPSGRFVLSQSAPLMIPTNPNRTMTARVIQ